MRNEQAAVTQECQKKQVIVAGFVEEDRQLGGEDDRYSGQTHQGPQNGLGFGPDLRTKSAKPNAGRVEGDLQDF